ncbi:MAG: SpoIIE family protein phosphatase [Lawsonibacter sp.]|nr:SpoIIE family protein phosphatase [Lawsonibacter sp.]
MTARETIRTKLRKLRRQSQETGQVQLSAPALALGVEAMSRFLLAAVLAGAVIFENRAPFGVALVAAAGSGLCGGAALVGACFGYLTMLEFSAGLRYASAAILTFAAAFAFYDLKLFRRAWTMPVLAGLFTAFTGIVVQSQAGWRTVDVIWFGLELVFIVLAAWCYRAVLLPQGKKRRRLTASTRRAGLLTLLCTTLMALAPLLLYKDISLGRILAVLAVLAAAWQGGPAAGTITGVVLGAAMDLARTGSPLYAMAYGLSGLAAGLRRGKGRAGAALIYALANAGAVLWTWGEGMQVSILYEVLFASLAFLLIPEGMLRRLGVWLAPELSNPVDLRAQKLVRQKLESTSQAFRTLCDSLRAAFRPPENDNDITTVFDRAASRVCQSCSLRGRCWKQDYNATFNALNDATPAMVERGRAQAKDFPRYFADRCLHFSAFLAAVNEELTALFYRRQYNARIRENRAAVCRQYTQLSDLLGEAAAELSRELTPDLVGDRRLRARMAELGLEVRTAVFRDGRNLVRVEAEGPGCAALTRPSRLTDLSTLLGVPLRVEREEEGSLSLLQLEPLMAVAGVAARKKNGETVSGDAGTYFKRADGKLYVLLCDGMGSGAAANRESALAVRLLEQFLQAGVSARQALSTLSSALALRGEETGGFTTVDLLQVDLFTGEGELFKLGAAPTYVKRKGDVQRFTGTSLPAGLAEGEPGALDQFALRLAPGDMVLMVSDGVCSAEDDSWVRERLAAFAGESPKDLARELITDSPQEATDDRTALAIRIERRRT